MKCRMSYRLLCAFAIINFTFFVISTTRMAQAQTVAWKCSTSSGLWQDNAPLSTTPYNGGYTQVSVNPGIVYQKIDGWGGCFNEKGWAALSALDASSRDNVMHALFDANSGLKLNICRTPIGANDYSVSPYSLDETAGDYGLANFNITRDNQYLIPYIKSALSIRPNVQLWAVPWSPPSWMKDSNSLNSGTIKTDSATMGALALYFEKYVQAYKTQGVTINMVMPQNEPATNGNGYPECSWNGTQIHDFIRYWLGPKFSADGVPAQIWLGTLNTADSSDVTPITSDPVALSYINGAAFQWGGLGECSNLHSTMPGLDLMQSETVCGNHENDWPYAQSQFALMKSYLEAGVSSYMLWNMVLDQTGQSSTGWAQCSPIVANTNSDTLTYTPQYYMFKHFSYFVQPGAHLVSYQGDWGDKIAFVNPNGEVVLVMQNSSSNSQQVSINLAGRVISPNLPANSWNTFILPSSSSTLLVPGTVVSLKAVANGQYVCADLNLANPPQLVANRTTAGAWESFTVVDAGNGNIGLRAQANGQYVCADLNLVNPPRLIANRTSIGAWETFTPFDAGNGNIALRAQANGQYVCADLNLVNPPKLIADQSGIGTWQTFGVLVH